MITIIFLDKQLVMRMYIQHLNVKFSCMNMKVYICGRFIGRTLSMFSCIHVYSNGG